MPVISFVNPKGGSGKTTNSFALAEQFALGGLSVCLLDTDPNGFAESWMNARVDEGLPAAPFDIEHEVETSRMVKCLKDLREKYDVVLVDTEGTANEATTRVLSRSHLVIIPLNPSYMDAEQAGRAVGLITEAEELLDYDIHYRIFFSRAPAMIRTATQSSIVTQLEAGGLKFLESQMSERRGFRDIFEFNRTLTELVDYARADYASAANGNERTEMRRLKGLIEGYEKCLDNAEVVVNEIVEVLKAIAAGQGGDGAAVEGWQGVDKRLPPPQASA